MSIRKSSWHQAGLRAVRLFDLPKTWLDPKSQKLARIETWLWHFFANGGRRPTNWPPWSAVACRDLRLPCSDRLPPPRSDHSQRWCGGGQRLIEIYSIGASCTVARQSARFMRDVHYRCIHCIAYPLTPPPTTMYHHVAPAANGVMAIMMIASVAGGVNLTIPLPPPAALNWRVLQFLCVGESSIF